MSFDIAATYTQEVFEPDYGFASLLGVVIASLWMAGRGHVFDDASQLLSPTQVSGVLIYAELLDIHPYYRNLTQVPYTDFGNCFSARISSALHSGATSF